MRLLELARSRAAAAIAVVLSLISRAFPVEFWDRVPRWLQLEVLALGWLLCIWLALVACSYRLESRLALDERGLLRDWHKRPYCPACRNGLLVYSDDSFKCPIHGWINFNQATVTANDWFNRRPGQS
jgi:hypothetical protein